MEKHIREPPFKYGSQLPTNSRENRNIKIGKNFPKLVTISLVINIQFVQHSTNVI